MKQFIDELHETLTFMFTIFMAGLVALAFLLPCFL